MGQIWFIADMKPNTMLRDLDYVRGNLIGWRTARIRRIARSTFASETLSAVDCTDRSIYIADLLSFVIHQQPELIGVRLISDCCSLVQHVQFSNVIAQSKVLEKRLTLDLQYIKDEIRTKKYIKELLLCMCLRMFGRSERILTHGWHGLNRRQANPLQITSFSICLASII